MLVLQVLLSQIVVVDPVVVPGKKLDKGASSGSSMGSSSSNDGASSSQ